MIRCLPVDYPSNLGFVIFNCFTADQDTFFESVEVKQANRTPNSAESEHPAQSTPILPQHCFVPQCQPYWSIICQNRLPCHPHQRTDKSPCPSALGNSSTSPYCTLFDVMSMAMVMSAPMATATSTGTLLSTPPSIKMRSSRSIGGSAGGIALVAKTAEITSPSRKTTFACAQIGGNDSQWKRQVAEIRSADCSLEHAPQLVVGYQRREISGAPNLPQT